MAEFRPVRDDRSDTFPVFYRPFVPDGTIFAITSRKKRGFLCETLCSYSVELCDTKRTRRRGDEWVNYELQITKQSSAKLITIGRKGEGVKERTRQFVNFSVKLCVPALWNSVILKERGEGEKEYTMVRWYDGQLHKKKIGSLFEINGISWLSFYPNQDKRLYKTIPKIIIIFTMYEVFHLLSIDNTSVIINF